MADTQLADPGPRSDTVPQCEETMEAVIYDVSETSVPPHSTTINASREEHLSPLHRMAEIALATSPNMAHRTLARIPYPHGPAVPGSTNEEVIGATFNNAKGDRTEFVLPSQQYYESGAALLVPPSSTQAGVEVPGAVVAALSPSLETGPSPVQGGPETTDSGLQNETEAESTRQLTFSSESNGRAEEHQANLGNSVNAVSPNVDEATREHDAVADTDVDVDADADNHRYTHFKLQPKNKSPPSFRVVQLKSGPVPSLSSTTSSTMVPGEDISSQHAGLAAQDASASASMSRNGTSTSPLPVQHTYIDQHVPPDHRDPARSPDASYTDPILHVHAHPYPLSGQEREESGRQEAGSWSTTTSPVMAHPLPPQSYHGYHGSNPPQQQHQSQNRLSIFDLVAAAEASERENAVFQQQQRPADIDALSAAVDVDMDGSSVIQKGDTRNSNVNVAGDGHETVGIEVSDHPEKKPSSSRKKTSASGGGKKKTNAATSTPTGTATNTTPATGDTGIIGHIPLRENSRSISKLLWAENGGTTAAAADEREDAGINVKAEMHGEVSSTGKGKKRQSNGAVKSASGTGGAASSSLSRTKGKKITDDHGVDRDADEMAEDEEAGTGTSQPKKKGRKNESSSSKSNRKSTGGKNRSGSLDSTSVGDKKANGGSKQKSVQIHDEPEFFEHVPAGSGKKGRGTHRVVTPEAAIDEEEEEEDNTLYCVCKKSFNEDSSTMVECDVCQNWYHISCVGVAEEDIGLLDQYVCPVCEKDPSVALKTCYKDKCQREGCRRPGRGALSKFCSDTCGIHHALGRLKTNKVKPSQVIKSLSTVIQPEGIAVSIPPSTTTTDEDVHVNGTGDVVERNAMEIDSNGNDIDNPTPASQPFQDRTLPARLAIAAENAETCRMYQARKQEIELSLEQLDKRDAFLRRVIEKADALPDLHSVDEPEETTPAVAAEVEVPEAEVKKSKKKKSRKSKSGAAASAAEKAAADERPCGFDFRFLDDDALREAVEDGSGGGGGGGGGGNDNTAAGEPAGEEDAEMRNKVEIAGDHRPGPVCLAPRKKCDRHAGWQKLRTADLDLIRLNLTRQLDQVNKRLEACSNEPISAEPILLNGSA